MTREAFKQILRDPETTKKLARWAEDDRIAAIEQQRKALNEAAFDAGIRVWYRRTDPVVEA